MLVQRFAYDDNEKRGCAVSTPSGSGFATVALVLMVATWILPRPASGVPVTVGFSGELSFVPSPISSQFSVGDAFTALLSYETTAAETGSTIADPSIAIYPAATTSFTFAIGSYSPVAPVPGDVFIVWDDSFAGGDALSAGTTTTSGLSGPVVNGFALDTAGVLLRDTSGAVFSSDAVPTSVDLPRFDIGELLLQFNNGTVGISMIGRIDLTSTQRVPAPATLLLLLAALVGLRRGRPLVQP